MPRDIQSVDITPEQFESLVFDWLKASKKHLNSFNVTHLGKIKGDSGEYEIDVVVEFEFLGGALFRGRRRLHRRRGCMCPSISAGS